jgi:hypothetical protein
MAHVIKGVEVDKIRNAVSIANGIASINWNLLMKTGTFLYQQ